MVVCLLCLPGQILSIHASVFDEPPSHGSPPYIISVTLNLWSILKPSPHVTEQSPSVQSLHSQCTEKLIEFLVFTTRKLKTEKSMWTILKFFTWTFLFVTAFHNWSDISIWTFITPMKSCLIYCSGKSSGASSARQRAILNDPSIPCTMNYEINSSFKRYLVQCQSL